MGVGLLRHQPALSFDLIAQSLIGSLDVHTLVLANFRSEQPVNKKDAIALLRAVPKCGDCSTFFELMKNLKGVTSTKNTEWADVEDMLISSEFTNSVLK